MRAYLTHAFHLIGADCRRKPFSIVFTVLTIALACLLLLSLSTLVINAQSVLGKASGDMVGIIFLRTSDQEQAKQNVAEIEALSGIDHTQLLSPDEALLRLKTRYHGLQDHFREVMPWVVFVHGVSNDATSLERSLSSLKQKDWIEEMVLPNQEAKSMRMVLYVLQAFLVFLAILIAILVIVVISNHIRVLAIQRAREVEVMQLVGATNLYVRLPFLIEGALLAMCGALLASFVFAFVYHWLENALSEALSFSILGLSWVRLPLFWNFAVILFAAILGLSSAFMTLRSNNQRAKT